jgi:twitching motility protein PilT
MDIRQLLAFSVQNHASDLHLSAGLPPMLRVNGDILAIELPELPPETVLSMLQRLMPETQLSRFNQHLECDFSYTLAEIGRFRVNAFWHERGAAAVFRIIPTAVQSIAQLALPPICAQLLTHSHGLILVTGPTGSGKTTTLAAMIDHLNATRQCHIITIEDPIEFIHPPKEALIHQREIGAHTAGFSEALHAALREDPDVLMIGEMRDLATLRLALTAAETGHLVLATLHTSSAINTIDRIVGSFPAAEKEQIRHMLSESLVAILAQVLLKTADDNHRIAAHEILIATPAIRNLIREGKTAQMLSSMQTSANIGMQTLAQELDKLVQFGKISAKTQQLHTSNITLKR